MASSTTPTHEPPSYRRARSKSPGLRPTTPLRPSSRNSLRDSAQRGRGASSSQNPLADLQDGFAELSDAMADLEQNFVQLQLMHQSLARFSESFAGFLYGLNMNAFCVDFPEAPVPESFKRAQHLQADLTTANLSRSQGPEDMDATFLTTDTSFIDCPPSNKAASKFHQPPQTPTRASKAPSVARGRGGIPRAGGRGRGIPTRGGATRGTRGESGSGIARGAAGRGRGTR